MSVIYLVRHGQGSFGTANYDLLSPAGREQARLLGLHFAESGERIDALYSGTLVRQRQTAELIAESLGNEPSARLPITQDPAFDEYEGDVIVQHYAASLDPAERERLDFPMLLKERTKFQLFLEQAARAWVDGSLSAATLLPWSGFYARIAEALTRIMREQGRGKTLVIATSGGVIGTVVAHVLGLKDHTGIELNWAVHNASITRLMYSSTKLSLSMFNALPHLEQSGRRELITYR